MNNELSKLIAEAKNNIKQVVRFEDSDRVAHFSEDGAVRAEEMIITRNYANDLLSQGKSIGAILEAVGKSVCDPILYKVTKDTELVISYYQCKDTPGYKPTKFNYRMNIYCYGDAGSWSGSYGNWETPSEVARYAKKTFALIERYAQEKGEQS